MFQDLSEIFWGRLITWKMEKTFQILWCLGKYWQHSGSYYALRSTSQNISEKS